MAQLLNHEVSASAPRYETYETKADRRRNHLYKPLAAFAGLALSIGGLNVLAAADTVKADSHNNSIDSILLEDGARLRNNPTLGNSAEPNFPLFEFSSQNEDTVTIETPHGVDIKTNNNGEWYGIQKEDLIAAIPSSANEVASDSDGIIWVNQQRGIPHEADEK